MYLKISNSKMIVAVISLAFVCCCTKSIAQYKHDIKSLSGVWQEMENVPDGISKRLVIRAVSLSRLQISFYANNAPRRFSNSIQGVAILKNNIAVLKPFAKQRCRIVLKFIDGDLIVTETGECGWGRGISTDGHYIKQIKE
ncbi:MAG TPA: hypothetical protein DCQ50_14225 [Chryseobacterium sp.]|nr:hypothetical protein [Chryseobacterium sp.]